MYPGKTTTIQLEFRITKVPLYHDMVSQVSCLLLTGAFDQHGCPLVIFPVDAHGKLTSEITKEEVVDFINYFLCLDKYVMVNSKKELHR